MHSYQHNIKTFNNATRHLTHVERALYRDLIEMYYDTEQPLPANDFDALARKVLARTDAEKDALKAILAEFFVLTGNVYSHDFCDEVIDQYKKVLSTKATAGKASAEARRKKAAARKWGRKQNAEQSTEQNPADDEQAFNGCSTDVLNHKPETMNHEPVKKILPQYLDLAQSMGIHINPITKRKEPPNLETWADDIRKLVEIDNRDIETVARVFGWANQHHFWQAQILSAANLRKHFDKLVAQMGSEENHATQNQLRSTPADRMRAELARIESS